MSRFIVVLITCVFFVACGSNASKENKAKSEKPTVAKSTTPVQKEAVSKTQNKTVAPAEKAKTTAAKTESSNAEIKTVSVSNLEDLVTNAKSNTTIYLEKGTYKLDADLVYFMTKDERRIIDKKVEETKSIGGQLHFSGLDNFQIIGKKGAKIISENPQAVAFFVVRGKNLKFSNLTIKKEIKGLADLAYVSNCQDVEIDRFNFDGGGTYGIYVSNVKNMKIKNSKISKCSSGAVRINNTQGLTFLNSTFSNNKCTVPMVNFYGNESIVTFDNVTIADNQRDPNTKFEGSDRLFASGNNALRIENCTIQNNKGYVYLGVNPAGIAKSQIEGLK